MALLNSLSVHLQILNIQAWMSGGFLGRCSTLCGGEFISLGAKTLSFIDKGNCADPVVVLTYGTY